MANDTAKGLVGEREWTITIQNQVHRDRWTSKMCWQTLCMPLPTLPLKHSWPISNFSAPAFLCQRLPLTTRSHWPEQMSMQMKAPLGQRPQELGCGDLSSLPHSAGFEVRILHHFQIPAE